MFRVAAPSESNANEIPATSEAGLTRLPLASNGIAPLALAEAIGSWITAPEAETLAPEILNCPPAVAVTVTPRIPAAFTAFCSAVA